MVAYFISKLYVFELCNGLFVHSVFQLLFGEVNFISELVDCSIQALDISNEFYHFSHFRHFILCHLFSLIIFEQTLQQFLDLFIFFF